MFNNLAEGTVFKNAVSSFIKIFGKEEQAIAEHLRPPIPTQILKEFESQFFDIEPNTNIHDISDYVPKAEPISDIGDSEIFKNPEFAQSNYTKIMNKLGIAPTDENKQILQSALILLGLASIPITIASIATVIGIIKDSKQNKNKE